MGQGLKPGRASLDELLELDETNGRMGRKALGPLWEVADETAGLFVTLAGLVMNQTPSKAVEGRLGVGRSLLYGHRCVAMALLNVVRFHFVEAAGDVRRMLEWFAIASHLFEEPEHYRVWERAHLGGMNKRDDPRYRLYRKIFNPGAVQVWLSGLSEGLVEHYQRCNLMAHGTIASQARSISHEDAKPSPILAVSYIDMESGSVFPVIGETYQVLNAARSGLSALAARILEGRGLTAWEQAYLPYIEKSNEVNKRWRELLAPELAARLDIPRNASSREESGQ